MYVPMIECNYNWVFFFFHVEIFDNKNDMDIESYMPLDTGPC